MKTMLDFILWYNDIDLMYIHERSKISYPILIDLKKGVRRKYTPATLQGVANALGITVHIFYDIKSHDHKYFKIKSKSDKKEDEKA